MARTTRQVSDATAARVLDAARTLIAERGFAAVGLDEVAALASVTRGAVYHHYGSKLGVFRAVHAWAQQMVADAISQATDPVKEPWQAFEVGCRAFLEAAVRDDLRQILLLDAPAVLGWAAWRDLDAQNSGRLLTDALGELSAAGLIDVSSVPACQALLSGAMNEAALRAASVTPASAGIDEAWPVLHRLLCCLRTPFSVSGGNVQDPQHPVSG
jgi:AcrR family transcriptional regulator